MIPRPLCLAALCTSCGVLSGFGAAAPAVNPTADSLVSSANPANNYGAAGALEVSAVGSAKGEFDSFIRFNFASTQAYFNGLYGAGNWTPQSVTLTLTTSAPNNALFNASATGAFSIQLNNSDAWLEGTGTPAAPDTASTDLNYNNRANYESAVDPVLGTFTFAGGTTGTGTYTLTLSSGFLADVKAGGDASFYVAATDAAVSYLFNSTNFTTASARPSLVVNAVPEPSAVTLLSLAAGGLALAGVSRWRRHRAVRAI